MVAEPRSRRHAAREAAAGGADRFAVASARREDRLFGALREGSELMGEARQREIAAAHVPRWLGDAKPLEVEDPALGDAKRDRPWKPAVEGVGRHALEAILLGALEKLLEA